MEQWLVHWRKNSECYELIIKDKPSPRQALSEEAFYREVRVQLSSEGGTRGQWINTAGRGGEEHRKATEGTALQ